MNSMKLYFARRSKKRTQKQMAEVINKTLDSYSKKERGKVSFSVDEIVAVTADLDLTFEQVNQIFFDGNLRCSKSDGDLSPSTT